MQIPLGGLGRKPMPHADDGALERGVEAFSGVDARCCRSLRIVPDVFANRVIDAKMRREFAPHPAIRWQLICDEDSAEPVELLEDESGNGALRMRLALFRLHAPAAFSGDDHALARAGSPLGLGIVQLALGGLSLLSLFAAERRLIDRDDAAQQI